MNTKLIAIVLAASSFLAACATEKSARSSLLEQTPLGTSFDGVLAYCQEAKLDCMSTPSVGYFDPATNKAVGVKSIRTDHYQHRRFLLMTKSVEAYWGFDSQGRLIDVSVRPTAD
jgi:hypothetical protein